MYSCSSVMLPCFIFYHFIAIVQPNDRIVKLVGKLLIVIFEL